MSSIPMFLWLLKVDLCGVIMQVSPVGLLGVALLIRSLCLFLLFTGIR